MLHFFNYTVNSQITCELAHYFNCHYLLFDVSSTMPTFCSRVRLPHIASCAELLTPNTFSPCFKGPIYTPTGKSPSANC